MKTKVISIMSQKGGVGKSSITNSVILDLSMKLLLKEKRQPRILLIDADAQASVYLMRKKEVALLQLKPEGKEFQALDKSAQLATNEMRKQLEALHAVVGWNCLKNYEIYRLDLDNVEKSLQSAMAYIDSEEYDYVFIDMPGTVYQQGTGELFERIEHLFVPVQISNYDVESVLEFSNLLDRLELRDNLKTLKYVFNKFQIIRKDRYDEIERELLLLTGIQFVKTKIKDTSFFPSRGYNTLMPCNYRINLNTGGLVHNTKVSNIGDFTSELLQLTK